MRRIVLDTNCLIQMLSSHSPYYAAWKAYQAEKYALCVSNDTRSPICPRPAQNTRSWIDKHLHKKTDRVGVKVH